MTRAKTSQEVMLLLNRHSGHWLRQVSIKKVLVQKRFLQLLTLEHLPFTIIKYAFTNHKIIYVADDFMRFNTKKNFLGVFTGSCLSFFYLGFSGEDLSKHLTISYEYKVSLCIFIVWSQSLYCGDMMQSKGLRLFACT